MYLIGLTGNIACGKTTVVRMLETLGAQVIDADTVAHRVMEPGEAAYLEVVAEFGSSIVTEPGGSLDRQALGAIVFSDPQALRRLERIVHPAVHRAIEEWLAEQRRRNTAVAVIDAIKLIEAGWPQRCDAVWVVACQQEQQLARLIQDRGMSEQEARRRITAQGPQADKLAVADVVIDNGASLEQTRRQVLAAWSLIPGLLKQSPADSK